MTDGNIEEANELLNHIYEMRKTGLANNGEFAFENLLFKALRNRGYLDKLRSYIANAEDLSLSLNESANNLEIKDEDEKKAVGESFTKAEEKHKNLTESFFNTEKGDTIYYTTSESNFVSIIKNKFKDTPVRVYYDFNKNLYVFGNALYLIHSGLFHEMVMNTNKYKQEEKQWDRDYYHEDVDGWQEDYLFYTYLEHNAALFQIVWNSDIEKYTRHDGYDTGYWAKYDNFYIICRDKEYRKCRKVPILWNVHFWSQEFDSMQSVVNESVFSLDEVLNKFLNENEINKTLPQSLGIDYQMPPYEELKK